MNINYNISYFLLYESMLDCVLYARDKYLNPDGIMFPDKAVIYLATIEDDEYRKTKIDFWYYYIIIIGIMYMEST